MDTTIVILLILLILVVGFFGINTLRSNTSSNKVSGAAISPQSLPSQYGGGGCGR
jgi:hypothetical protein